MKRSTKVTEKLDTFDVISNFIKGYLTKDWHNSNPKLQELLNCLRDISSQLKSFIKGNEEWRLRFPQMVNCFIDCDYDTTTSNSDKEQQKHRDDSPMRSSSSEEEEYDSIFVKFSLVADGLFDTEKNYEWYSIILFLTYAAEVASYLAKKYTDERDEEECNRVVSHITACIAQYIDENLLEWIESQESGWLSIKQIQETAETDAGMRFPEWTQTSKYATVGALFAIAAGLYISSKFSIH